MSPRFTRRLPEEILTGDVERVNRKRHASSYSEPRSQKTGATPVYRCVTTGARLRLH